MAKDPNVVTITGRLAADPEIHDVNNGTHVTNIRIMSSGRTRDPQGVWHDGEPTVWRCAAWRDLADNIADSLAKGDRVIALAWPKPSGYTAKDGHRVEYTEWQIIDIAASIKLDTLTVHRQRDDNPGGSPTAPPTGGAGDYYGTDWDEPNF